jgi:hypothetical protein
MVGVIIGEGNKSFGEFYYKKKVLGRGLYEYMRMVGSWESNETRENTWRTGRKLELRDHTIKSSIYKLLYIVRNYIHQV